MPRDMPPNRPKTGDCCLVHRNTLNRLNAQRFATNSYGESCFSIRKFYFENALYLPHGRICDNFAVINL